MKKTYIIVLVVCLILLVAFIVLAFRDKNVSLNWRVDEQEINTDGQQYASSIYLDINGEKSDLPVITVPSRCNIGGALTGSPIGTISGVTCWWAGAGDEVVAVTNGNKIEVYHRQADDGWDEQEEKEFYKWNFVKTLEIK